MRPVNHPVVPTTEAQRPPLSVEKVSHQCQARTSLLPKAPSHEPSLHTGPSEVNILRSSGGSLLQWEVSAGGGIGSKGARMFLWIYAPPLQMPQTDGFGLQGGPSPRSTGGGQGAPGGVRDTFLKEARGTGRR